MVRVYTRFRLRDAAQSYQQPLDNLRMVTPRAESSPSNCATPGEVSRSPGTMTAHSRFSRNSFDLICHCPKDDDFASPIWTMDQCRTSASAAASSGNGPDGMSGCSRVPEYRPYVLKPPDAGQQPGNRLRNGRRLALAHMRGPDIGSLLHQKMLRCLLLPVQEPRQRDTVVGQLLPPRNARIDSRDLRTCWQHFQNRRSWKMPRRHYPPGLVPN